MAGGWFLCLSWGLNTILPASAGPQLSPPSCVALGKSLYSVSQFPHLWAGFTTVPTSVCGGPMGFTERGACHVKTTHGGRGAGLQPFRGDARGASSGPPTPGLAQPPRPPLPPAASCPALLLALLPPRGNRRAPADVPFSLLPLSHTRRAAPAPGPLAARRGGAGRRLPCGTAARPTRPNPRVTPARPATCAPAGPGLPQAPRTRDGMPLRPGAPETDPSWMRGPRRPPPAQSARTASAASYTGPPPHRRPL